MSSKKLLNSNNLRVHQSKPVKAWLAEKFGAIEVFYLPSYGPELTPDELAFSDIKLADTTQAPAHDAAIGQGTSCHWRKVQRGLE